ncbi:DsrE/DsrF/DrsH-like family protein [Sulfuriferula thiophila]|uniref:DsrE/DsrF/DrsH-like family protein n=1 Tax=Sulfuriferula thiophila TaxID=1781211 RepID=UPI000F60D8E1|nr:DsrE/DsrF/DrsH-like family protein [Sulfuriferula thiophila]
MEESNNKTATVMVVSGDMDKVLVAFIVATGFASMGVQTKMWFTMYGANCLKRRRGLLHSWFHRPAKETQPYRRMDTDTFLQKGFEMLNRGGPGYLPLSRHNLFGLGPLILNYILKRKGIPNVEQFIQLAEELGISFTICQICVDALALDTSDLVASDVNVKGVAQYMKDAMDSHYNIVL